MPSSSSTIVSSDEAVLGFLEHNEQIVIHVSLLWRQELVMEKLSTLLRASMALDSLLLRDLSNNKFCSLSPSLADSEHLTYSEPEQPNKLTGSQLSLKPKKCHENGSDHMIFHKFPCGSG